MVDRTADPPPASSPSPIEATRRLRLAFGASCRDADPCAWSGGDLFLTLRLGNASDVPVELPIAFLQRRGPVIALLDARSGERLQLRTSPPPGELLDQRTTIPPGGAEVVDWVLHESELVHFGRPVDLTAEITLFGAMRAGADEVPFEVSTTLRIHEQPQVRR